MPRKIIERDLILDGAYGVSGDHLRYKAATPTTIASVVDAIVATPSFTGNLNMNNNYIYNLASPTSPNNAASKAYVDAMLGVSWLPPVDVVNIISDAVQAGTPPAAVAGDAWVVNTWGGGHNNGDIKQYNGAVWVVVAAAASVTTGFRALITSATPAGSFAGKAYNIAANTGGSWVFTTPTDAMAVFCKEGYYDSEGFVYDITNKWVIFGVSGTSALFPLVKSWNTISVNQASTVTAGYVTLSDFNAFNNKAGAIASPGNGLSFSTPTLSLGLASSGVTGALGGTDWITFNNKAGAVASPGNGLSFSTPTLTLGLAATGATGALSMNDWNTFNNRLRTILNNTPSNLATSGLLITATVTATMYFGNIGCYIPDGTMQIATASSSVSANGIAMCVDATINAGTSGNFLLQGVARNDSWSLTGGQKIFLSTLGGFSITAPATVSVGYVVQSLGMVMSTTKILFNPNLAQVVIV